MSKPSIPSPRTSTQARAASRPRMAEAASLGANGAAPDANSAQVARGPGLQPKIATAIPGPRSRALFADEQRHLAPGRQRIALLAGGAFDHGEGATLTDVDGNVYVDFFAGVAVASLGHGHPALAHALARQAERLIVGTFATPQRAAAFQMLTE